MEYVVVIDRPLIDDQIMELVVPSKEEAAEGITLMILIESQMDPDFKLISKEITDDTITVVLGSGTVKAYPKVDKKKLN